MDEFKALFDKYVSENPREEYSDQPDWSSLTKIEAEAYWLELDQMAELTALVWAWWLFTGQVEETDLYSLDVMEKLRIRYKNILELIEKNDMSAFLDFAHKCCGIRKEVAAKMWCKVTVHEINHDILTFAKT